MYDYFFKSLRIDTNYRLIFKNNVSDYSMQVILVAQCNHNVQWHDRESPVLFIVDYQRTLCLVLYEWNYLFRIRYTILRISPIAIVKHQFHLQSICVKWNGMQLTI